MIHNKNFEIFLNSENPETVAKYMEMYPFLAGITTNPIMISRLGRTDYFTIIKELRSIIGNRKLFTQVTSKNTEDIITEVLRIRDAVGENAVVKIPAVEFGMEAIHKLSEDGVHLCATLCTSTIQGVMALSAGADYVVPFYFHMDNDGIDPVAVTSELVTYTKTLGHGKVLTAAHRNLEQFGTCIGLGVQACTLNPDYITEGMNNDCVMKNLNEFLCGWESVFGEGTCIKDLKD
jgi:transaldolase